MIHDSRNSNLRAVSTARPLHAIKSRRGAPPNTRAAMLTILLLLGTPALAQADPGATSPVEVLRATLDNGLKVAIVRDSLAPVVTTEINYLVGSDEAPPGFPGMAHAQEHMMFRGSPGLTAAQLAYLNAAMGGMANADTQQSVTQYFTTVPAADLELALRVEAIRMSGVLDSNKLWEEERGAIEQEVARDLSSPDYLLYTKLLQTVFANTVYAHDALGTRASFDKTTGTMLEDFYRDWYAPNNAILVIVGDVDPQRTLHEVQALFGSIPARKLPPRPHIQAQPPKPQTFHLNTDRPRGMVVLAFQMPGYDSPDYAASELLGDVLSSQRADLYDLVVHGQAQSASFEMSPLPRAGLGYAVASFAPGADAQQLARRVKKVLAHYAHDGVPADLVTAAKRREITALELQKSSVSDLATAWSQALAVEGRQSPEEDIAAMKRATAADVSRVARRYLDMDHAVLAIATPQPSAKPVSGRGFGGKESFAPQATEAVQLPDWARHALQRLAVPASAVHPSETILPNGLRLIVQPESISDTVSVYGRIRNEPDLETPEGKEGVSKVLDRLLSFGTQTLERKAYQRALDEIGATESPGTDFSVQSLSSHFERAVALLADNELHPALPEKAFPIVRAQVAGSVKGDLQSPQYLTRRALRKALYPKDDPTLRQATPQSVAALSLQDVRDYYDKVYRPDLTTIVVIGKVTPAQARSAIEKYFGPWRARGPEPDTVLPPVAASRASTTRVSDASRVQDEVLLAETLEMNRFDPDYYPLQLGDHALGGGFYATRLYQDLREHAGLVYQVASVLQARKTRTAYLVEYACDPGNVARARTIIERDLRAMQTTPLSPDMLHQAKAMLLTEIPLDEASVDDIADGLLSRANLGLPLDEPTRAARRYVKLTAEEVKSAFARRLRVADLAQVTLGPQPH